MTFYRHHPCNPWFGKRRTTAIGGRENQALWIFTPLFDVVIKWEE